MKVLVGFKTPDAASDGARRLIRQRVEQMPNLDHDEVAKMSEEDIEEIFTDLTGLSYDNVYEEIAKFVSYGEYINIEIDIDTGEAVVLPITR